MGDISPNLHSFVRHLRAENKSPSTVVTYSEAINQLAAYLEASGMPTTVAAVTRKHVEAFLIALQEKGHRPATVSQRFRSLQQFFKWLRDEGEIKESPMANTARAHRAANSGAGFTVLDVAAAAPELSHETGPGAGIHGFVASSRACTARIAEATASPGDCGRRSISPQHRGRASMTVTWHRERRNVAADGRRAI